MEMQSHWAPQREDPKSFFEKPWFMRFMAVLVLLLAVAIWWVSTHPGSIQRIIGQGPKEPERRKPTVPQKPVIPNQ